MSKQKSARSAAHDKTRNPKPMDKSLAKPATRQLQPDRRPGAAVVYVTGT